MNANELRIGNFVYENNGNVAVIKGSHVIGTITVIYDKFNPKIEQQSIKLIKPIRLTEEWLKDFGFEYSKRAEVWFFGENPVTKDWMLTLKWLDCEDCPFYRNGHFKVKYVHKLQNLYFALTGVELQLSST